MKSSSPPSPVTSSSSPPPLPRLSLQSPELQAEFLQEHRNKLCHRDFSESRVVTSSSSFSSPCSSPPFCPSSPLLSPFSATPCSSPSSSSSSSPCGDRRSARLSLSSPELLSELKESRTRPLRHVPTHKGMTTIFTGRGRQGLRQPRPQPN